MNPAKSSAVLMDPDRSSSEFDRRGQRAGHESAFVMAIVNVNKINHPFEQNEEQLLVTPRDRQDEIERT